MASVYRPTFTRPIPDDAEILTRRGKRVARYRDGKRSVHVAPLNEDGTKIVLSYKCWYVAYRTADNRRERVKGFTDREATEQLGRDLERQAARKRTGLQVIGLMRGSSFSRISFS